MDTAHTGHGESPTFFFGYCRQCSTQESQGEPNPSWLESQPAQPAARPDLIRQLEW